MSIECRYSINSSRHTPCAVTPRTPIYSDQRICARKTRCFYATSNLRYGITEERRIIIRIVVPLPIPSLKE